MKAIKTALFYSLFIHTISNAVDESPSSQLASRLAELSKSGEAIVHKEYREDIQTVTQNKDGQYVVHVDSVIGQQNDDQEPTIQKSQDEFIVPSDLVYTNEEEALNKMWEQIWKEKAESNKPIIHEVAPLEKDKEAAISDEWILPEWQYIQDKDKNKLFTDDDIIIPPVNDNIDYLQFWDNYSKYMDYEDVWQYDEAKGEWTIDPIKYEKKYGIKLNMDSIDENKDIDTVNDEIKSLQQDIKDEQDTIEVEKDMINELKNEKKENELNIEDIISIDPDTGNIKVIDEEGFKNMFGVYPSFEDEISNEQVDEIKDNTNQGEWWSEYDTIKKRNVPSFKDRMDEYNKLFSNGDIFAEPVAAGAA